MRNSQKRKLNCEKSTKDMKDIGRTEIEQVRLVLRRQVQL